MNAHIIKLFGQPDKGIIQFFLTPQLLQNSEGAGSWEILQISTKITIYRGNSTR